MLACMPERRHGALGEQFAVEELGNNHVGGPATEMLIDGQFV